MDLITNNNFKNGLIVILLVLNLLTVSIIWMQAANRNENAPGKQEKGGADLMKEALDLSDDQAKEFEQIRKTKLDQAKRYNDSLNYLKKQLAQELLKEIPDSANAKIKSQEIGEMQTKVEMIRFKHFKELMRICTPEQKEKLKPIMMEIFGRKPPKEEAVINTLRKIARSEDTLRSEDFRENKKEFNKRIREEARREAGNNLEQGMKNGKQVPPAIEERLERLSDRLNLTQEQIIQVKSILQQAKALMNN